MRSASELFRCYRTDVISRMRSINKYKMNKNESELLLDQKTQKLADPKIDHLFNESAALNVYDDSVINLAAGCPGPDLLKPLTNMMRQAVDHRMTYEEQHNYYLFQYGPTSGLWGMRQVLADFLTKNYGSKVNREDLVLTCGASHGLHLLVSSVLASDGPIFVEEYTYMIALHLFKEFPGHPVYQVPMKSDGIDVEKLREIASSIKGGTQLKTSIEKPYWALLYTVPNFHNPTSVLFPPEKCRAIVKIARELDFLVVCDDVYNMLYYGDGPSPPDRLFSYDKSNCEEYKGGHIVSNASFSKILAPGIRVGWMEVPTRVALKFRQSGIMQSGGSVNNVMFGLVQSLIETGLAERHLLWYKQVYKERMKVFCDNLEKYLPKNCTFTRPIGGYFVWVKTTTDTEDFLNWCLKRGGPGAVPGSRFMLSSSKSSYSKIPIEIADSQNELKVKSTALRLSIGFHNANTLRIAAEDLGNKLKQYMSEIEVKKNSQ